MERRKKIGSALESKKRSWPLLSLALQEGSPHKSMTVKSQSPLAFTPTSVMRKMTADKSGNPDGKGSDNWWEQSLYLGLELEPFFC